jgi:hypothetical protein
MSWISQSPENGKPVVAGTNSKVQATVPFAGRVEQPNVPRPSHGQNPNLPANELQPNAILIEIQGVADNMIRSASRFILIALGALVPWLAQAQVDWTTVSGLTDADKKDITEIITKTGMYNGPTTISETPILSGSLFVIRTPVQINGVRRAWHEISLCRKSQSLCPEQTRWGIGDWRVLAENSIQERWHFSDDEWEIDIELGSAISYAEAQSIVLAIHRNQLKSSPDLADFAKAMAMYSSNITSVQTDDPITREFRVEISSGGSGHTLFVRLQDADVILYDGGSWIADGGADAQRYLVRSEP